MRPLDVDGSTGEGGGQIFRLALALAGLTGREVRVTRIRAGRRNPGLAPQHLTAAEALVTLTGGQAKGLEVGSQEVRFRPGPLQGGRFAFDVGTAGSVTLVLQACLLPALFADGPVELRVRGGTDVKWSPPADYTAHVFLPLLAQLGARVTLDVVRRGYYPRGGGEVRVAVKPVDGLRPLQAKAPGLLRAIEGRAHVANLPADIPKRMKRAALAALVGLGPVAIGDEVLGPEAAVGRGGAIVLWTEAEATRLGASALAEKGVPAETLGRRAAVSLRQDLEAGATLDVHGADQLLPYLAVADGPSSFRVREVTGHTETLLWLLPRFLDASIETERQGTTHRVTVRP